MRDVVTHAEAVTVRGALRTLTYRPRLVTLDDGTSVAHESAGGTMASVWATDLGSRFVEVVHLGDGPVGGELVLVVPDVDLVVIGDLYAAEPPTTVTDSWPVAVDLALGLTGPATTILTSSGPVTRDDLDALHQRLLRLLHG